MNHLNLVQYEVLLRLYLGRAKLLTAVKPVMDERLSLPTLHIPSAHVQNKQLRTFIFTSYLRFLVQPVAFVGFKERAPLGFSGRGPVWGHGYP